MAAKQDDIILKSIRDDIRSGNFKPCYLFYGEEKYLLHQYKHMLLEALKADGDEMNFSRYEGNSIPVRDVIDLCETMPFLAERRVILMEDTGFFKNKADEMADYMKSLPDYLHILFTESQVDKRSRMYKAVKTAGQIVEFVKQDEKKLMEWAAGVLKSCGRRISRRNMELLLTKTGTDMGNLRMELEKLVSYTEGRDEVLAGDIETICTTQTVNKIFEMVRSVAEKNQKRALELYDDLLTLKEPPMRILFLMARQYRQLLLVKEMEAEGVSPTEIITVLGVSPRTYREISSCARAYTQEELIATIQDFAASEEAVKTGRLQDLLSVELLIIKYSSTDTRHSSSRTAAPA